jgi:hypothetical protein
MPARRQPLIAEHLILPQAEAMIRATGADLRIGGDRAFYVPAKTRSTWRSRSPSRGYHCRIARVTAIELSLSAELVDAAPDGPGWLHEIKYDGYRMHARLDRGAVRLLLPAFASLCGAGLPLPSQAQRYGAEMTLPAWRERLVCSKCGSREVDMVVTGMKRRRE